MNSGLNLIDHTQLKFGLYSNFLALLFTRQFKARFKFI
jgi:hypothetical protein